MKRSSPSPATSLHLAAHRRMPRQIHPPAIHPAVPASSAVRSSAAFPAVSGSLHPPAPLHSATQSASIPALPYIDRETQASRGTYIPYLRATAERESVPDETLSEPAEASP